MNAYMTIAEMSVIVWCVSVGLTDLYLRRIPNILTIGAYLVAISSLLITGQALLGAQWQSVAMGVVLSLLLRSTTTGCWRCQINTSNCSDWRLAVNAFFFRDCIYPINSISCFSYHFHSI
jgi:hypothetical protein